MPPQPETYSLSQLNEIAEKALTEAPHCIEGRRVDIERLIDHFGVRVETRRLAEHDVFAFVNVAGTCIVVDSVLMDTTKKEKLLRFTLAEELAHLIIHRKVFASVKTLEDRLELMHSVDESTALEMESNAKALAGALLMPKSTVEPFVEDLCQNECAALGKEETVELVTGAMVQEYDVNYHATMKRLKVLGYHRRRDYLWDLSY